MHSWVRAFVMTSAEWVYETQSHECSIISLRSQGTRQMDPGFRGEGAFRKKNAMLVLWTEEFLKHAMISRPQRTVIDLIMCRMAEYEAGVREAMPQLRSSGHRWRHKFSQEGRHKMSKSRLMATTTRGNCNTKQAQVNRKREQLVECSASKHVHTGAYRNQRRSKRRTRSKLKPGLQGAPRYKPPHNGTGGYHGRTNLGA